MPISISLLFSSGSVLNALRQIFVIMIGLVSLVVCQAFLSTFGCNFDIVTEALVL